MERTSHVITLGPRPLRGVQLRMRRYRNMSLAQVRGDLDGVERKRAKLRADKKAVRVAEWESLTQEERAKRIKRAR